MEKKKQENKMRRDQLNDQYLELLDQQRLYFKTVKDFKEVHDRKTRPLTLVLTPMGQAGSPWLLVITSSVFQECRKNEVLLSKLRAKGAS